MKTVNIGLLRLKAVRLIQFPAVVAAVADRAACFSILMLKL
jgi:hypothetical protein